MQDLCKTMICLCKTLQSAHGIIRADTGRLDRWYLALAYMFLFGLNRTRVSHRMQRSHVRRSGQVFSTASVLWLFVWGVFTNADEPVDFNRQIRPLLSNNCLVCHGFDEGSRSTELRLDTREGAIADLGGYSAVVPGKPEKSALLDRIRGVEGVELMPPTDSHKKPLPSEAIATITQWIAEGAEWGEHWSFEAPVAMDIPAEAADVHPIDYFVKKRLQTEGLALSHRAAKHTLMRRLSFDLTGLPPGVSALSALGEASDAGDWSRWVDSLLASPHYGERMAMWWLDGARYSDTDGFQGDATRQNWPWRDWVVSAFNDNMPFDQFTVEQFAGDLLPDATDEQRLATCFHRNHMHNGEGGRDPAESRVDYVLDRTNTVGTLWLGLTLGCAQCHDHKFDPISQSDYYSLTAFFNSIDETGAAGGGAKPFLSYKSGLVQPAIDESQEVLDQMKVQLDQVKIDAEVAFSDELDRMIERAQPPYEPWTVVTPVAMRSTEGTVLTAHPDGIITANDSEAVQDDYFLKVPANTLDRITGIRLEVFSDPTHKDAKYSFAESGEFILTNVKLQVKGRSDSSVIDLPLRRASASSEGKGEDSKYGRASGTLDDDPRTGWTTRTKPVEPVQIVVFELAEPLVLSDDGVVEIALLQRSLAPRELMAKFRVSVTNQRGNAVRSLKPMPLQELAGVIAKRKESQEVAAFTAKDVEAGLRTKLKDQFLADHVAWQLAAEKHAKASRQLNAAKKAAESLKVTVLKERPEKRKTHVLVRGVWNDHGDEVEPAGLSAVMQQPGEAIKDRLQLGRWIVSRENPLTSRVIVNHVWQLLFGAGLVRTPSDFGAQGEMPTHPQLLDWLAVDFMEHGWDLKHLIRRIVTSETYQQDSSVTEALLERDPENELLARGARFRLPSWMIRDASLAASGLLNRMVGGPPIFAYQPVGVWQDQFMGRFTYEPTLGPGQYRRTLYTFWRRSSAPTFLFDSAMRRTCEVEPRRTNTPLHALTLLNDVTALESARTLAEKVLGRQSDENVEVRLNDMFQSVLSRKPSASEIAILGREHRKAHAYYSQNPSAAKAFVSVGQLADVSDVSEIELAADTLMASLILNLDESITHE